MRNLFAVALTAAVLCVAGCIKTENTVEVKPITLNPIQVTLDINIKVDRDLDTFFGDLDAMNEDM